MSMGWGARHAGVGRKTCIQCTDGRCSVRVSLLCYVCIPFRTIHTRPLMKQGTLILPIPVVATKKGDSILKTAIIN